MRMVQVLRGLFFGSLWIGSLCLPPDAACQSDQVDSVFLSRAVKNTQEIYAEAIGVESHLYNGVLYKEFPQHRHEGHPYFITEDWQDGSIFYDGELYEDVPIIYDLVQDKIFIEHAFGGVKLELIREKVKYFKISGHTFVRLGSDSARSPVRAGFYDLLYDGQTKALAKLQKAFDQQLVSGQVLIEFRETNRYYIVLKGRYYSVKSKASVLKVLEDRAVEIKKFIRKNKIHFRHNWDQAIARVVEYYDHAGNQL